MFLLRGFLRLVGSLILAVVLMATLIVLLVWGTLVESYYGAATTKFLLYDTHAFAFLFFLIGLNVLAALLLRLTHFSRRSVSTHTGFFAAHIGILVLLYGALLTQRYGEEGNMMLLEGEMSKQAYQTTSGFAVEWTAIEYDKSYSSYYGVTPFAPGTFHWSLPLEGDSFLAATVRWARYFQKQHQPFTSWDVMCDRDDNAWYQLKILDYYGATTTIAAPPLEVSVSSKGRGWENLALTIPLHQQSGPARGARATNSAGERVTFTVATSRDEVAAFRGCAEVCNAGGNATLPNTVGNFSLENPAAQRGGDMVEGEASSLTRLGSLAGRGTLILHLRGKCFAFAVDDLLSQFAADSAASIMLGESSVCVEKFQLIERLPMISCDLVSRKSGARETVRFFADAPEMNLHATTLGIFGAYLVNPQDEKLGDYRESPTYLRLRQPRLDFLQSPEGKLFWNYWNGATFSAAGEVSLKVRSGEVLTSETISVKISAKISSDDDEKFSFAVEKFVPHDFPGGCFRPAPVSRATENDGTARVKLAARHAYGEEEFWLRLVPAPNENNPEIDQQKTLYLPAISTRIIWTNNTLEPGFVLRLNQFIQQNEPGTRMAAGFTSVVDELDWYDLHNKERNKEATDDIKVLRHNIPIRMNAPATIQSMSPKRFYRVYQASRSGPYRVGEPGFAQIYDGELQTGETAPREEIWRSILSVNYDPGRGYKYLGCFLIVIGIVMMMFRIEARNAAENRHQP